MWCCYEKETELEIPLPQLASEHVLLPPTPEPEPKEKANLSRAATAQKLAEMESSHFFTVQFNRLPGTSFGLDVSSVGRVCMVNAVLPDSLAAEWNQRAASEGRPGEVIQQQLGRGFFGPKLTAMSLESVNGMEHKVKEHMEHRKNRKVWKPPRYDRLMAVNDERPDKGRDISEKMKNYTGKISIVIQRPVSRKVQIRKNGLKDIGILDLRVQ